MTNDNKKLIVIIALGIIGSILVSIFILNMEDTKKDKLNLFCKNNGYSGAQYGKGVNEGECKKIQGNILIIKDVIYENERWYFIEDDKNNIY